jgi:S1-C subfamily serine protease
MGKLTPDLAAALDLEESDGILVNDVVADSPADQAGLKPADVITEFDGKPIQNMARLRLQVGSTEPGDQAKIEIFRDGKPRTLTVEIGALPNEERGAVGSTGKTQPSASVIPGVEATPLNDAARERFGIPADVKGLVVLEVDPDSAAAVAGLAEGDVVTEIERESVATMSEAREAVRRSDNGRLLLRVKTAEGTRFIALDLRD